MEAREVIDRTPFKIKSGNEPTMKDNNHFIPLSALKFENQIYQ
jgi:hypothetical protein